MNQASRMTRPLLAAALLPALLAPPAGHAQAPPAAERHHYVYYPKHQIYYAPDAQLWFWREGDGWTQGAVLPLLLQQYTRDGYNVYLDTGRPYEQEQLVADGYRHRRWTPYHRNDVRMREARAAPADDRHGSVQQE
ncbi:MAG: hypothetical protein QM661_15845 [Solimonas sp.]